MSYEFKVLPFGVMNALEFNAENLKTSEDFTKMISYDLTAKLALKLLLR